MSQKSSFFTLHSASSTLRVGRLAVNSIASGGIDTPCLLVKTSRFLPQHLTPDNLDHTIPCDTSVLEMNIDYILENEAILKSSPLSVAELAGVSGKRATCLSTRVSGRNETKPANIINGNDFVTVHNASGSNKFDLKTLESVLTRFKPDFLIGPFDEHVIPVSLKRVRKAVDRNLKYEKICEASCGDLPFISSISGADIATEKERNVAGISQNSSGIAFCDLHKLSTFEERLQLLKGICNSPERQPHTPDEFHNPSTQDLCRIVRGSVCPSEMEQYLPFTDIFDTTYVDELTAKGHALQLNFKETSIGDSLNLEDEKYFADFEPISSDCPCPTCKNYSRAYVHHLLKSKEMLAGVLLMMHNLNQYYRWLEHLKTKNIL